MTTTALIKLVRSIFTFHFSLSLSLPSMSFACFLQLLPIRLVKPYSTYDFNEFERTCPKHQGIWSATRSEQTWVYRVEKNNFLVYAGKRTARSVGSTFLLAKNARYASTFVYSLELSLLMSWMVIGIVQAHTGCLLHHVLIGLRLSNSAAISPRCGIDRECISTKWI